MNDTKANYLFFTGKGGVGKTSLACATAVESADAGNVVLLVSTDPASNLHDVLESPVDEKINPVKGIDRLFAININPEKSAEEYRNRVTLPLEGIATRD
ncbi:MAG: AAA family ATPase, partial [Cyclobacteriaceae bacterium]|nr:AAA family ATPase [Cyclobacteriaceae bacterium]